MTKTSCLALQQGKPPCHRPLLHAGPKEIIAARETGQQFGELGPALVWLRPLQTRYGWQTAGYLPRLLQFRGSWQGQADPGNAVGTGKGQDNY